MCYGLNLKYDPQDGVCVCSISTLWHYYFRSNFFLPILWEIQRYIRCVLIRSTYPQFSLDLSQHGPFPNSCPYFNPVSPVSITHMCTDVEPSTGTWATYPWKHLPSLPWCCLNFMMEKVAVDVPFRAEHSVNREYRPFLGGLRNTIQLS